MDRSDTRETTMLDVAQAAGVGVATVDRVLNGRARVRPETAQRVLDAAERLGFRRAGLIRRRISDQARQLRLGFVLQKKASPFYQEVGRALREAAEAQQAPRVSARVEYLEELTPRVVAAKLLELSREVDAIAVVAADHPHLTQTVDAIRAKGVPVFAFVSDLSAESVAGYVGIDNRKVGRTAAWAISRLCAGPGKVGLILGSHRYLCQEQCEVSFRSYLRECAPEFQVLETLVSLEDKALAQEATLELLQQHPDLVGVYVAGGGVEGVIEGLQSSRPPGLVTVCHDLTEVTRQALIDGVVTLAISHPYAWMARRLCQLMSDTLLARAERGKAQELLPFITYTAANV